MYSNDPIAALLGEWSVHINAYSVIFRIVISVILASIIGCERSSKRHSAGLRTFILTALASTAAMLTDLYLCENTPVTVSLLAPSAVVGTAMISGNSILFSSRNQIKGLTTSVGLWTCAIIGLAAGAGMYTVTLIAFIALLFSLALFPGLETILKNRSNHFEIHLELTNKSNLQDFTTTIRRLGLRIDDIESNPAYLNSGLSVYTVSVTIISPELKKYKTHSEIISALSSLEYVYHIEEMN